MATKFKTKVGTYPNRSGIEQIPAGSSHIPQSYLNSIGRNIDSVRINSQHAIGTKVTPGGVQFEELNKDTPYSFPFKVTFVGLGEGGLSALVTIQEGRIHGRIDNSIASYSDPEAEVPFTVPSLGVNSVVNIASDDPDFPPPEERPDEDTGGNDPSDPSNPSNNNSGGGSTNYNNPKNPSNPSNPGKSTQTNTGSNSGSVYHKRKTYGNLNTYPQLEGFRRSGNLNTYSQLQTFRRSGNLNTYPQLQTTRRSGNLNTYSQITVRRSGNLNTYKQLEDSWTGTSP